MISLVSSFAEIALPEYLFSDLELKDSKIKHSNSFWYGLFDDNAENYHNTYYVKYIENIPNYDYGIEIIIINFDSIGKSESSILEYYSLSNALLFPPKKGSFSGKKYGNINYVQGYGVDKQKIFPIEYYKNIQLKECDYCFYHLSLYVLFETGFTIEIIQNIRDYKPWMGKLDPELLESLAEKVVEVYHSKKCKIKIEPHKWNFNWSEDNAKPEGLINVWIAELDDGISIEDIDISTIILNGKVPVTKNVGYEDNEKFKGKILHLQFKKKDSFGTIFFPQKGDKREICIEGKLKNGENFIGRTEVEIK